MAKKVAFRLLLRLVLGTPVHLNYKSSCSCASLRLPYAYSKQGGHRRFVQRSDALKLENRCRVTQTAHTGLLMSPAVCGATWIVATPGRLRHPNIARAHLNDIVKTTATLPLQQDLTESTEYYLQVSQHFCAPINPVNIIVLCGSRPFGLK